MAIKGETIFNFSDGLLIDKVDLTPISASTLSVAPVLAKRSVQLCKTTGKEPRNFVIPIAESNEKGSNYTSFGILLGTANRMGDTVDIWVRQTEYTKQVIIDQDGKPLEFNNVVQTKKVVTGKYTLAREIVDCHARKIGIYEVSEYDGVNGAPKSWSTPRNQLSLSSVIPDSVGETIVEATCAIYGPKGRG
ncbi:hypothetical protein ACO0LL_01685 [Undibacterium sp. TC4M20W]|uniref:hypothetical protein n=1 Tax=unclassified Undibacterium TaxID=2630295 RepID=UPI003BF135B3